MSARKGSPSAFDALQVSSFEHRSDAARNAREAANDAHAKATARAAAIVEGAKAERDAVHARIAAELAAAHASLETALAREFRSTIDPLVRDWRNERTHKQAAALQATLASFDARCMHDLGIPLAPFAFVCAMADALAVKVDPVGLVEPAHRFGKASAASLVSTLTALEVQIEARARAFDPRFNWPMLCAAMTRESFLAAHAWRAPPPPPEPYQGMARVQ
jgi:hypothetical protein